MANRTLLCVEPDGAAVELIRAALSPYGFETRNLATGEQVIDWSKERPPAAIVLAVEPKKVGYALCSKIKRVNELKDIPVILISSEETLATFEQHKKLKARADEYILKPLKTAELIAKLDALVSLGQPAAAAEPPGDEILLTAEAEELAEVSIEDGDVDIVEERTQSGDNPVTPAPSGAVTGGEDEVTGPLNAPSSMPGAEPQSRQPPDDNSVDPAMWNDEATRAQSFPSSDLIFARKDDDDQTREMSLGPGAPEVPPSLDDVAEVLGDVSVPISLGLAEPRESALQARVHELETDVRRLQDEAEELRTRASSQPLSREKDLLNLREVINRKDKDLLDVRDALDAKERQILDHKDRVRENERARRDLEEKMLGFEKGLVTASERVAALSQDKDKILDREKGLKARLDDALTEIAKAHQEADGLKKKVAASDERSRADMDRFRGEMLGRVSELEDTQRKEVARLLEERVTADKEHEAEAARLQATHAADLDARDRRAGDDLAAAEERHQGDLAKLRKDSEKAVAAVKEEQARQLAAEREAMLAAVENRERDHRNEILGLRHRHEAEAGAAEERRQHELAEQEARRLADIEAAEARRRGEAQARDEEHHAGVAEMDRRHFKEKTEIGERHRGELDQAAARAARSEGELAARTEELAEAQRRLSMRDTELDAVRADVREREVRLAQARDRASELEGKIGEYEDQILRAYQKLRTDEKTVDKAKRALAVALSLLDTAAPASSRGPSSEENPT